MDPELRAFFDFNSMHMEPWDGPAGIVMSDGRFAACNLDRNGLRPARYVITKDKLITCASEVGIWDYQPDGEVVERAASDRATDGDRHPRWAYSAFRRNRQRSEEPPSVQRVDGENVRRLVPFEDLSDESGQQRAGR